MRYVDKRFLSNCYGETGHIVVQFQTPRVKDILEHNYWTDVDGGIEISDCSKTINLDFTFNDKDSMEKRIAKIDILIEVLQNARDMMPVMLADLEANLKEAEEQKEGENNE